MLATDMTGSGTPEEKLRWAFRMYDKDNSGEKFILLIIRIDQNFLPAHIECESVDRNLQEQLR